MIIKNIQGILLIIFITFISFENILSFNEASFSKDVTGFINGRVVDERQFPVPRAKVIINGIEAETDNLGKFNIINIPYPYDVTIADRSTATAVIYKGLSIDNPELILFGKAITNNINVAGINVTFPEIPEGSSAVLKFISPDIFYSEDVEVFSGENNKNIRVEWPVSKKNLRGNVIFLQKNKTGYGQYEDKVISLNNNPVPYKVNLTGVNSNSTKTSDLVVYLPFKNYTAKGYSVFADFQTYSSNSDVLLVKEDNNNFRTTSIIPAKLPIAYRVKVQGFVNYKDGSGFVNYTYSQPGATLNLTAETPPEPQTPTDKLLGANGNTEFYYSLGSGTGIFVIPFRCADPVMNFYIVTADRTTNLTFLSRPEFRNAGSVEFNWRIRKYLTYFSVNEFAKPSELNNDRGYSAVLFSKERTFKTGYY